MTPTYAVPGLFSEPVKVVTTNIAQSAVATDSMTLDGFSATVKWESIEFSVSSSDTTGCSATPTATLASEASPLEIQITGLNQGCEWDIEMKAKCGTQSSDTAHSIVKFCTSKECMIKFGSFLFNYPLPTPSKVLERIL